MKFSAVLLTFALALSVSAAPQQQKQNAIQNKGGAQSQNNNKNGQNGQAQNGKNGQGNANAGKNANNNNNNNNKGNNNAAAVTLDPKVIAKGFANNGQDVPTAGQVASLTSTNNFINFCLTVPNLPLTNGQQITTGSCNPAPMGIIPSSDNMPSSKFVSPKNGDTIKSNTAFTITMAISNLETGNFVNAQENYFAAPQQLNGGGVVKGHSHVVVEQVSSFQQTTPTNPKVFAFFKGLNDAAQNGQLTAAVTNGLPAGTYKLSSINTAANHQPVLVPIAQHGSLDDAVYVCNTAAANNNQAAQQNGGNKANNNNQAGQQKGNNNQAAQQNNGQKGAQQNNNNNKQGAQQNNGKNGAQQNNGNKNQQNQGQQKVSFSPALCLANFVDPIL
ncbi:hypothetical protein BDN72DRAFT_753955 [Pluteus cervinus]|uniref:Uncharacterized protein n=1 Tax=Pluteus cervinus TaxID=181527 RepID=A0ACD3BF07_9AGAR|nr:hypothetical protein BDN72DRAFT_753955 [Pluteus cervinus]